MSTPTAINHGFGFLRMSDLAGVIVPAGKSTIWRWVSEGKFPRPVKINQTITAWRVQDVIEWCDEQAMELAGSAQ